ncbi:DUF421 domain-containing protein, partial [Oxalobacteraceae bacterium OM1]
VGTLIAWNVLLDIACFHVPLIRRFAKPPAMLLVKNGRLLRQHMRREFISEDELMSKLRQEGVETLDEVRKAFVEPDGEISVIKRK